MKEKYFIDLFGGCGGLSLGLEQAGFTIILFNELNAHAAATYQKNVINHHPAFEFIKDARELLDKSKIKNLKNRWKEHNINDVDLLVGGPPCWGYSVIGYRRTFDRDKKNVGTNHLYKVMVNIIKSVKPKMFMFENVAGLMSSRWTKDGIKGEIWNDVEKSFYNIKGYRSKPHLVHGYDYGVPQNRPRVIIMGIRDDLNFKVDEKKVCNGLLPEPIDGKSTSIEELLSDLIDPSYPKTLGSDIYLSGAKNDIQRQFRTMANGKLMRKGSPLANHTFSRHSRKVMERFKYMLGHNGEIKDSMKTKKFGQRLLPPTWINGHPTITITSLPDDFIHFCQPRILSVREWARLQTFPDYYEFTGPRTTGGRRRAGDPSNDYFRRDIPQYSQIGNAVPVRMAREFGKHFMDILK